MDFVQTVVSLDEKSRRVTVILEPNPKRYEWQERGGERCLYDKFDKVYIPERVFAEFCKQATGKPIFYQPQKIGDAEQYIESRRLSIKDMLKGKQQIPTFQDKSENFLQSLKVNKLEFVILALDIVGSTKLATETVPETYARLISTTLYELSEAITKFHGHVLKYTGDGFIAYFPSPSFITKNDLAIDCAFTLHKLVYQALNPILKEQGFPTIGIRIGLDAGEAYIETVGSPETKQHKDIIGVVVSLAAKIQARAKPGEIYLGDTVERNLHTMWRQICEPIDLEPDWDYKDSNGELYKVHRASFNKE